MIRDEQITYELVYNADVPRKTLAIEDEKNLTWIRDMKDCLIVLACANFWAICCRQWYLMMTMKMINEISEDFVFPKRKLVFLNLEYAKTRNVSLTRTDLEKIISINDNVPKVELMSDFELIKSYSEWWDCESQESVSEIAENDENISTENLIEILSKAIGGLEWKAYISEDEASSLIKIKDKVIKNKPSML